MARKWQEYVWPTLVHLQWKPSMHARSNNLYRWCQSTWEMNLSANWHWTRLKRTWRQAFLPCCPGLPDGPTTCTQQQAPRAATTPPTSSMVFAKFAFNCWHFQVSVSEHLISVVSGLLLLPPTLTLSLPTTKFAPIMLIWAGKSRGCDEHPKKMTAAQAANLTSDGPSEVAINW